jgi:hypothetical protein
VTPEQIAAQIEETRTIMAGQVAKIRERSAAYLRAYAPVYDPRVGDHDQWGTPIRQQDEGKTRSSFNIVRSAVGLWTAFEADEMPSVRWIEQFIPTPPPSLDELEQARREAAYRGLVAAARSVATLREQVLMRYMRASRMDRAFYRVIRRKNIYGHAWLKLWPDPRRRIFLTSTRIDPSTVYPRWSAFDERRLDAILVAYRQSAVSAARQFPGHLQIDKTGAVSSSGYYNPTAEPRLEADRRFVWIEDYWYYEPYEETADLAPSPGAVWNAIRVNGSFPVRQGPDGTPHYYTITRYDGWTTIPYFLFENSNERDYLGFSDAGTLLGIQDGINRLLSVQQDVIEGEARPKWKYRGTSMADIRLTDDGIIRLEPDEDLEQLAVHLDVFPTQVHGTLINDVMAKVTGLPDTVWGRITQATNSGRALSYAWRSVAARLAERNHDDAEALERVVNAMLDWMELYDWDNAREIYGGNREYEIVWPNKEPRDFTEVTLDAINKLQAGIWDLQTAMEAVGEKSPDERIERVRSDYLDPVLHPEKAQAYLLLQRLKQAIAIEAQQAGMAAAAAQLQLAGAAGGPPSIDQQQGQAEQAQAQAAAERAPRLPPDQNAPATQAGAPGNAGVKVGTLIQDGRTFNRFVTQGEL